MLKAGRLQWFLFALAGVVLFPAFVLSGKLLAWATPTVQAAGTSIDSRVSACSETYRTPSFGSDVIVSTNEVVCSDLTAFGGTVAINGEVRGNIVAFNSDILIQGKVTGTIHLFGGRVSLLNGSHVIGDIHLYGSTFSKSENVQFAGSLNNSADEMRNGWIFGGNGGFTFPFWSILTWVALGLLLTTLLPEHVMFVRTTVFNKKGRSFFIGLLSLLLAPVVFIVLVALILSIPLAFIVALGLIAAWALGTVAIGWHVGDLIMRRLAPQQNTRPVQVVVGLTVLALVGSLPYIGWLISLGVGVLGLGAVFLSRFGTRLYSSPKQPLTL
jgi:hypothetical protein